MNHLRPTYVPLSLLLPHRAPIDFKQAEETSTPASTEEQHVKFAPLPEVDSASEEKSAPVVEQQKEETFKKEEDTTSATENPVTEQTTDIPVSSHAPPQPIAT